MPEQNLFLLSNGGGYSPPPLWNLVKGASDDTRDEDADGDEELVQGYQTTTDVGWSSLSHINGYSHGGKPWKEFKDCFTLL